LKKILTGLLTFSIILSSTTVGIPTVCAFEEVTAEAGYDYALSTDEILDADERTNAKLEYNKYGFAYENFGNKIYENQVKSHESCAISGTMSDGYTAFNAKNGAAGVGWDGGWTITKDASNSAAYANWVLDYSNYWDRAEVSNLENRSGVRFNGLTMQRKLINPVDLSVDGDYFVKTRWAVGKKVTDTVKDKGGLSLELLDDSGNDEVVFGANVPEGSATFMTPYVSGSGYDNRISGDSKVTYSQWYVFLMHIETSADGMDKLSFIFYPEADPSAVEIITDEVDSHSVLSTFRFGNPSNSYMLLQDVGIDCFNDSITGSPFTAKEVSDAIINSKSVAEASEVYAKLPECSTKEYYKRMYKNILDDTYNNIAVTETSEEEARESFIFLGNFKGDYDWSSKVDELKDLCSNNGWNAASAKLKSASPEDKSIVYADTVDTIELTYDYLLDESGSVALLQNGAPVDADCTVSGYTVILDIKGDVEKGIACEISTENLTDYKGDAVPGIIFSLSMLPVLSIEDGGVYTEGSKIEWETPEAGTCTVTLKKSGKSREEITSPYTLSEDGDYILVMLCEAEGGFSEERTVEFTVNKAVKPQVKDVKITGEPKINNILTGTYQWYSDNTNEKEKDSKFVWYRSSDSSKTSTYEKVAETKTYKLTEADENRWLKFAVIPGSDSPLNPLGDEAVSEPFAAAFNPVIKALEINGNIEKDGLLESIYEYYDENGDAENKSKTVVKWYASADKVTAGEDITSKLGSDGKMKITEDLFEKYVYITVKPASSSEPKVGEIYTSERYLMPKAPVISDVKITGTAKVGNTLTVDYKYYDENGDIEGASVIEWKNVDTGEILGTGRTLLLTSSMKGKIINVTVKGVSQKAPFESIISASSEGVTIGAANTSTGGGGGGGGGSSSSKHIAPSQNYAGLTSGSTDNKESEKSDAQVQETPVVKGFSDISGHWAEKNILSLEKAGIVSSDSKYRPDDSISRAELIALVIRSKGIELVQYADSYNDITSADWYAVYVQTALNEGIVSKDDTFRPNDEISREEAAKILAVMSGASSDISADFTDMDTVSDWAAPYVNAVYAAGIFTGDQNKCFNPGSGLTRAEAAAIIDRLIN